MNVLHDQPICSLLVLPVDSGGLDEFGFEANDGLGVLVAMEVDGEGIHDEVYLDLMSWMISEASDEVGDKMKILHRFQVSPSIAGLQSPTPKDGPLWVHL